MDKFEIKQICGIEFLDSDLICELSPKHAGFCKNGNCIRVKCITCEEIKLFYTDKKVDWSVCNQCGVITLVSS